MMRVVSFLADSNTYETGPHAPESLTHLVGLQLLILAIGIAKVVDALSWMVSHRATCKPYLGYTLALVMLGLAQLQYAWTSFYEYDVEVWSFRAFALVCLTPLAYLVAAESLYSGEFAPDHDFAATYQRQIWVVAFAGMLAQIVNIAVDHLYHRSEARLNWQDAIRIVAVVAFCGLLKPFPKHRVLHQHILIGLLAALVAYCLFLTPSIRVKPAKDAASSHREVEG